MQLNPVFSSHLQKEGILCGRRNSAAVAALENKLMNLEAIAAAIIHELKQPLTAIAANNSAALSLLEMTPANLNEARAALKEIREDVNRANETLNWIRGLVCEVDQARQRIDINEIILRTLHSMRRELADHGVEVRPELASLREIEGNWSELQIVISNLIHNSIEAMSAVGNRNRELRLTTRLDNPNTVTVVVQDSGPGIDPKQLDRMFDPFTTTKIHGMGLGLAICRTIIDRHCGQLTASSDGKTGASFQVVLPIKSPASGHR
jgi:C4-dicarboxylate-specific signal transduction histidine kinase